MVKSQEEGWKVNGQLWGGEKHVTRSVDHVKCLLLFCIFHHFKILCFINHPIELLPSESINYVQEKQRDRMMKVLRKLMVQGGQVELLLPEVLTRFMLWQYIKHLCEPVVVFLVMSKLKPYCSCKKNSFCITCTQLLITIPAHSFPYCLIPTGCHLHLLGCFGCMLSWAALCIFADVAV